MFHINDYVVYGSSGVCQIKDICTPQGVEGDRKYYVLDPVYLKETTIYAPVDNVTVAMRSIISKDEIEDLFQTMASIETDEISNDKLREAKCKDALRSCDYIEWIKVIKMLYNRKQDRISQGRKLGQVEERLMHSASDNLHGELAVALDMPKEEVEEYILEHMGQLQN